MLIYNAIRRIFGDQVTVSPVDPLPVGNGPKILTAEITRPANTTAYADKDIVNGNGLTTLPYIDLGVSFANKIMIVSWLSVLSDNGDAATKLQADVHLYSVDAPIADCSDNGAFAPNYANLKNRMASFAYADSDQPDTNTGGYMVARWRNEQQMIQADANGRIYVAVVARNAYTPDSGEKLYVRCTGFIQG